MLNLGQQSLLSILGIHEGINAFIPILPLNDSVGHCQFIKYSEILLFNSSSISPFSFFLLDLRIKGYPLFSS